MLLRHRSNWVVPIASISIALEDCAWIVWRIIRLYRGTTTRKNPTGIQRYLKSLRIQFLTNSLLRICKTPSNDDFYGTVGCTCKAFMELVHTAQILPPRFRSIFLIILPQKDFFLNIFIDL